MTTKFHLAMTVEGHVIEGFLTGGNVADITVAAALTEDVYGCYVLEDKGYDSDKHRVNLAENNNVPVIPGRKNRKIEVVYDRARYQLRRRIEMMFGKIKENRRLSMRYDKSDAAFLAFIAAAFIKLIIS